MEPLDRTIPDVIDLKTSNYFPLIARAAGIFFIVAGVLLIGFNIVVPILFIGGGFFIATTHYRLRIDFNHGTYSDYTWIFGFKAVTEKGSFERIQYIYINKNKVSDTVRVRVASTTFVGYDYNGYLKFSEKQKIHLRSDRNKNAVVRHMQVVAAKLNCPLHDYSEE